MFVEEFDIDVVNVAEDVDASKFEEDMTLV